MKMKTKTGKAEKCSRQASEHTQILSTRAAWASAADNFIFIAQRGEIKKKRKARRSVTHFKNSKNIWEKLRVMARVLDAPTTATSNRKQKKNKPL